MPRYDVTVKLTETDANAMFLVGRVREALRKAGVPAEEIKRFSVEAFDKGSYDELLRFLMEIVDVE